MIVAVRGTGEALCKGFMGSAVQSERTCRAIYYCPFKTALRFTTAHSA